MLVADLQTLAQLGQSAAPSDPQTSRLAARIWQLELHRQTALHTATLLSVSETDPQYSAHAAQIDASRQQMLKRAASDLTQIQALLATTTDPVRALLAADGGAGQVLQSIVAQTIAKQAESLLATCAQGSGAPSATDIADFLQQAAIVMGDEGTGGHDVPEGITARSLLADAGRIASPADGGAR